MKLIKNDNIDIYNITVTFLQILYKFFWNYNSSKILNFFYHDSHKNIKQHKCF